MGRGQTEAAGLIKERARHARMGNKSNVAAIDARLAAINPKRQARPDPLRLVALGPRPARLAPRRMRSSRRRVPALIAAAAMGRVWRCGCGSYRRHRRWRRRWRSCSRSSAAPTAPRATTWTEKASAAGCIRAVWCIHECEDIV